MPKKDIELPTERGVDPRLRGPRADRERVHEAMERAGKGMKQFRAMAEALKRGPSGK